MAKVKSKFYVVWWGVLPGIYRSWPECAAQVTRFGGARYKSFPTREQAEVAYGSNPGDYIGRNNGGEVGRKDVKPQLTAGERVMIGEPDLDAMVVDGARNTVTGVIEYQGRWLRTGELVFRQGPLADGTSNVAEFLAIVHALAYCVQRGLMCPVYSDSRTAIGWVKKKQVQTVLPRQEANAELYALLDRAEDWLREHNYNNRLLKWETRARGENPADFARK